MKGSFISFGEGREWRDYQHTCMFVHVKIVALQELCLLLHPLDTSIMCILAMYDCMSIRSYNIIYYMIYW